MSGQFAINLDAPTQDDLLRTVPDPGTRDLLYRLRLVAGPFSDVDVRELASVPKPTDHPAERLLSLLGLWVQRDGHDRYVVSPLVSRFRDANLGKETQRHVHQYLASRLVRNRPITAFAAVQAVHHYVAADLHKNAGMLLLSALLAFLKAKKPKDDALLSELWSRTALPIQIPFGLRVCIRATQITVYQRQGKNPSFLLADLEQLLVSEKLPPELQPIDIFIGGFLGTALWATRPLEAARHAVRSLQALRAAPSKVLGVRAKRIRLHYYDLVWATLAQIKTETELRSWLAQIDKLDAGELKQWPESKFADLASEAACNEIWLSEHRKPEGQRDWDRALATLGMVRDWAQQRGVTVLYAWAQWGTLVVVAEYLKRLDEAVALGEQAIAACASKLKAVFWLTDIIGRQYYYVGRWQDALTWLTRCIESPADVEPSKRAYVTALAGINAAQLNADAAVGFLSRAAEIVIRHPKEVPALLAASVHAELAFERWRRGERILAYHSWSHAADLLLSVAKADDDWKIAITLFGNFSGFFTHVAQGNSVDIWASAKPAPGRMFDRNASVLELFDPAKLFAIAAQLTLLADGLGLYDEALRWAARTSLADFGPELRGLIVLYRVSAHVCQGRFAEALDESWGAYAAGANVPTGAKQDVERAAQFSRHTGMVTVAAICFGLAAVRIKTGGVAAEQLSDELNERVRSLAKPEPEPFWTAAIEVMRDIASGDRHWRALYQTGVQWGSRNETQLDVMYRLAALTTAPPRDAFHLTMCSFQPQPALWLVDTPYHTVVVPFLRDYWRWAVEQYAAHFSTPPSTRRDLNDALSIPGEPGLRKALDVIARNLGVTLTEEYKEYLSEQD